MQATLLKSTLLQAALVVGGVLMAAPASAQFFSDLLNPNRMDFAGTLRADTAIRLSDTENKVNDKGNPYNDRVITRQGGLPGQTTPLFIDTTDRLGPEYQPSNRVNQQQVRGELSWNYRFTRAAELRVRGRAVWEGSPFFSKFDPTDIGSERHPDFNEGMYDESNFFDPTGRMTSVSRWHPFEWSGRDYMVDFPSFYVNYQRGAFRARVGNQQIAWGQLIFFRILDQVQGLDLRRHSALDFAGEEFSDKRVSAPGVRLNYQLGGWVLEAYGQKFQPTIVPNPHTPYNILLSGFTVHNKYDDVRNEIDYGFRTRGVVGPFTLQAIAIRRHEPLGQFRWVPEGHGFAKDAPAAGEGLGQALLPGLLPGEVLPGLPAAGTGELIFADAAHYPDPGGVYSGTEWFGQAGDARLDGHAALNNSITEVSGGHLMNFGATPCPPGSIECSKRQLDFFFQTFGPLTGNITQEYKQNNVFGGGVQYTLFTPSRPQSIFNQMIFNLEVAYEPNRRFTDTGLAQSFLVEDDWTIGLVAESWHRWTPRVPGMYMVWQFMHRTNGDLFGRSLKGFGGDEDTLPEGIGSFNAFVLAIQQPSPTLAWRFDLAMLYDMKGGLLVQPAVKWEPTDNWRVDAFVNYLEGSLHGKRSENIVSSLQDASGHEFTVRIGYQF